MISTDGLIMASLLPAGLEEERIGAMTSNPTGAGFDYPAALLQALADPSGLEYHPEPRGMLSAREAVCAYYERFAAPVSLSPEQVFLTASTSEAYSLLFRLLCEPGDEVLVGSPGYPLFDFLADIQDVKLRRFGLFYDHGWHVDIASLHRALTERTRAVVVVSPNNPTGSYIRPQEQEQLSRLCAERQLALIADEVFFDYSLDEKLAARTFASAAECLTFTVSGISKICCLPQMKLAWIAVTGPEELRREAEAPLDLIADTYLSVSTPVQLALPTFLESAPAMQKQVMSRVRANLAKLDQMLFGQDTLQRLDVEAGWYAVLRVPALRSDEELAVDMLCRTGIIVHPGHFFDFPSDGYLVLSLVTPEAAFAKGVQRLLEFLRS